MDVWDALRARRNVRAFDKRPLPDLVVDRILEAGRRAPSAKNAQPWDFVVVTDRDQLVRLASVWIGAGHVARSAATIALVLRTPEDDRHRLLDRFDLGQAVMAMMLAATDMGVGSSHASVGDQAACRQILGSPADRDVAHLLALGYPADRPLAVITRPDRRPFDEVVHRGRW